MRITLNALSTPDRRYRYYPIQVPLFGRSVGIAVKALVAYAVEMRVDPAWPSVMFIQDADQRAVHPTRGARRHGN